MAGLIALLRASGRGRTGWEPVALALAAILPPVFMCVEWDFHPEDLMAMGLALGSLACVRRGYWIWAGALLGLAFTSQQFVLLVVAPLVIVAPSNRRIRFIGSAIGSAVLVLIPLIMLTSGRVVTAIIGGGATPSNGAALLSKLHLHGMMLSAASRVVPVVLAVALAWWASRRLGSAALDPLPLASLIAASLALRLVFEVNLYGYYFMAVAVMLVILDVIRGRISSYLVMWVALVTLVFDPLPWGSNPLPHAFAQALPFWLWLSLPLPLTLTLAAGPLISVVRDHCGSDRVNGSRAVVPLIGRRTVSRGSTLLRGG